MWWPAILKMYPQEPAKFTTFFGAYLGHEGTCSCVYYYRRIDFTSLTDCV